MIDKRIAIGLTLFALVAVYLTINIFAETPYYATVSSCSVTGKIEPFSTATIEVNDPDGTGWEYSDADSTGTFHHFFARRALNEGHVVVYFNNKVIGSGEAKCSGDVSYAAVHSCYVTGHSVRRATITIEYEDATFKKRRKTTQADEQGYFYEAYPGGSGYTIYDVVVYDRDGSPIGSGVWGPCEPQLPIGPPTGR